MDSVRAPLGSPSEGGLARRPCATEGVLFQMCSVGFMGSFPFDYAQGQDERAGHELMSSSRGVAERIS